MHLGTAAATAALTAVACLPAAGAAHAVAARPGGQDKDCSDFHTQLEAQLVLKENPLDFFRLDADEDGIACEQLPGKKVGASTRPTEPATPTASATASPTTAPTATPTATPTGGADASERLLPPATRRPTGAVPAGAGGTAAGPSDLLLPLGLALTTLAVGGGVVLAVRRQASGRPGG